MATELKKEDRVIVRDYPVGFTTRANGSFELGTESRVVSVTSDVTGTVPWYILGDGYPYSGDALDLVSRGPLLTVGTRVVLLEPPTGMSWQESETYPGMSATIVGVEDDHYSVVSAVSDEPWWFTHSAVAKDNSPKEGAWYEDAMEDLPAEPVRHTNPKQAYGDKKVPLQLCPPAALAYMAIGMREGAAKYGAWNFRESEVEVMTYVGAIMRHLYAFVDGEEMDHDASLMSKPHLAGAMASLAILIDALEAGTAVDNRPPASNFSQLLSQYSL